MGKRKKSISFAVEGMFDKIEDGSKDITMRMTIPKYLRNEIIDLKERIGEWKEKKFGRILEARVVMVKPIQIKNITDKIAIREGFENAAESKKWLMDQYKLKSENNWMFATVWRLLAPPKPAKTIKEFITE